MKAQCGRKATHYTLRTLTLACYEDDWVRVRYEGGSCVVPDFFLVFFKALMAWRHSGGERVTHSTLGTLPPACYEDDWV